MWSHKGCIQLYSVAGEELHVTHNRYNYNILRPPGTQKLLGEVRPRFSRENFSDSFMTYIDHAYNIDAAI